MLKLIRSLIFPTGMEKGGWSPDHNGPRNPPKGPCYRPVRPKSRD